MAVRETLSYICDIRSGMNTKQHWEKVYQSKKLNEVSWYQPTPQTSLDFIATLVIPKNAAIIDVGGGDSFLAERLIELGYSDITVLDISSEAIDRARARLGKKAGLVHWIVNDITAFVPDRKYDCWHDRAVFHFLTTEEQVKNYLAVAGNALTEEGKMIIGTFSEEGPLSCSGLPVKRYSEESLTASIRKWFRKIKCVYTDHLTPFKTIQHFLFCSFQKIKKQSHGLS